MLLWKRLMGSRVLSTSSAGDAAGNFAAHVWCANSSAPGYESGGVTLAFTNGIKCARDGRSSRQRPQCRPPAPSVPSQRGLPRSHTQRAAFGMRPTRERTRLPPLRASFLRSSFVDVMIQGSRGMFALAPRTEYFLTAPGLNMSSLEILLNGEPLALEADGTVGEALLNGTAVGLEDTAAQQLQVPPLSYGFVVLAGADVSLCSTETTIASLVKAAVSNPLETWASATTPKPVSAVSAGVSGVTVSVSQSVPGTAAARVGKHAAKAQTTRKAASPHAVSDFDVERGGAAAVLLMACIAGICTAAQARRVARASSRVGWQQKEGAGQPLIRLDEGAPEGQRPGSRPSSRTKGITAPIARGSAAAADGGAVWGQFGGDNKSVLIAPHYVYGTLP